MDKTPHRCVSKAFEKIPNIELVTDKPNPRPPMKEQTTMSW